MSRERNVFDVPYENLTTGTTHICASVTHAHGEYRLRVAPYFLPIPADPGLWSVPLSGVRLIPLVKGRFSQKTLDAFVADPEISSLARTLAAVPEVDEVGDDEEDEQDPDSGNEYDASSRSEARTLAGMEGGNRGLADYDGLDLDGDRDDDRWGGEE